MAEKRVRKKTNTSNEGGESSISLDTYWYKTNDIIAVYVCATDHHLQRASS